MKWPFVSSAKHEAALLERNLLRAEVTSYRYCLRDIVTVLPSLSAGVGSVVLEGPASICRATDIAAAAKAVRNDAAIAHELVEDLIPDYKVYGDLLLDIVTVYPVLLGVDDARRGQPPGPSSFIRAGDLKVAADAIRAGDAWSATVERAENQAKRTNALVEEFRGVLPGAPSKDAA